MLTMIVPAFNTSPDLGEAILSVASAGLGAARLAGLADGLAAPADGLAAPAAGLGALAAGLDALAGGLVGAGGLAAGVEQAVSIAISSPSTTLPNDVCIEVRIGAYRAWFMPDETWLRTLWFARRGR
jgi:hypothetical protein